MTSPLSPAELVALRHAAEGMEAAESAALLDISPHTIKDRRKTILARLGAKNMPNAVHLAHLAGLLKKGGS